MSLEREIEEALGTLASEVRTGPPPLERAVGRARRRTRDRRIAYASLALAAIVATAVAVPQLVGDRPSGVILQPGPSFTPRDFVTPTSTPTPTASPPGPTAAATPPAAAPIGLSLQLSIPDGLKTAQIVEVTVDIRDNAGSVSEVLALWGDAPGQFPQIAPSCAAIGKAPATHETRELRHSYRQPGSYPIRVKVWTGHCQNTEAESEEIQGTITIGQGATPSNGPLPPAPHIEDRRTLYDDGTPLEADFYLAGGDEDGYVRTVVVDYGDGTTQTIVDAPLSECQELNGQWPSTYQVGQEVSHVYVPGPYTLTVTVTSVGCDGKDAQTKSGTFTFEMPY